MKTYQFEINIEALSETDALQKLKAAVTLMKKLKLNEIQKLAHIVEHDPIKTAFAKKALGV
jgi:hypothetical protein